MNEQANCHDFGEDCEQSSTEDLEHMLDVLLCEYGTRVTATKLHEVLDKLENDHRHFTVTLKAG